MGFLDKLRKKAEEVKTPITSKEEATWARNLGEALTWRAEGDALHDRGKYDEAIKAHDKAIEWDPNYTAAWKYKGIALMSLGIYDKAIDCFDAVIKIDPDADQEVWNKKGQCYEALGYEIKARQAYFKASEFLGIVEDLNGKTADDYDDEIIRKIYGDHKIDAEEAIEYLNKALTLDRENPGLWLHKGYCLMSLGIYDKAIDCFDAVLKIEPLLADQSYAEAWNKKGQCYEAIGDERKASEAYFKASELGYKEEYSELPVFLSAIRSSKSQRQLSEFDGLDNSHAKN